MSNEDPLMIKHLVADISVNGTRLTRASKIHLGTRDGQPIRPIRAERLANIHAKFKYANLTLEEVAALADGGEVRGASCRTLGIRREDAQAVLLIQTANQRGSTRLSESAQRAIQYVFGLTQKRLKEIASR